ncbi:hypothetical protein A3860_01800 [Niastella vici]|uniref:Uncharacterized protein n=1 Tax=Niastella vici TaxID=1703345 RepID=A0A1V9G9H2_9BACT|nr:hypothetical protein A3860_01800 [Niastella vici]
MVRTNEYPYLNKNVFYDLNGNWRVNGNWMVGNREIGLVFCALLGENVNSAHSPVKIKTVFLKINIFLK